MSVVAEATPEQAERITSEMLVRELSERIARLATIEHEPATIEAETDETDSDTDCQTADKGRQTPSKSMV